MKRKFSILLALVLAVSLLMVPVAVSAAVSPQFLDVVAENVDGEWVTTVEATDDPAAGTHSYHVFVEDGFAGGLQIIHKYIYDPTGDVGSMTLAELSTMTFWEYVVAPGGTNQLGAGIILYMDMDGDGVWIWENDAQIILESPYNDPQVTGNLGTWMSRDIDTFAGFQKGDNALGAPFTGTDGTTLRNDPLSAWQTSSGYATLPVLWIGIVAGWGYYSGYDGYFDDFTINGETYYLDLFSDLTLASLGTEQAVTTLAATSVGLYEATLEGDLTDMGGADPVDVSFEYGQISGALDLFTAPPESMITPGPFSVNVTGLTHDTTYYFQAKAEIDGGLVRYGDELSFTTLTEQIGISVDPTWIDFGTMPIGQPSATETVTVTNTGDVSVDLSASIENASTPDVYTTGLKISTDSVSGWSRTITEPDGIVEPALILTVPLETEPGTYTATLVFWAEATPTP